MATIGSILTPKFYYGPPDLRGVQVSNVPECGICHGCRLFTYLNVPCVEYLLFTNRYILLLFIVLYVIQDMQR